jgi:hypothetical protein
MDEDTTSAARPRSIYLGLFGLMLGMFLAMLDT